MTDDQFGEWLADHTRRFPGVRNWLGGLEAGGTHIVDQWAEALADVDLRDAIEVNRRMGVGDLVPVPAYEREAIGARVRAAAKQLAHRRRASSPPPVARRRRGRGLRTDEGAIGLADAAARIAKLVQSGRSPEEASRELGLMPSDSPDEWPRYRCALCRDTGTVEVWGIRSYHAARDGTLDDPRERVVCTAPCSCHEGGRFVRPQRDEAGRIPRYDPDWHCLAPLGDVHSAKAIAAFRQWFEGFLERRAPQKEPAFTAFNEGRGW